MAELDHESAPPQTDAADECSQQEAGEPDVTPAMGANLTDHALGELLGVV